MATSVKNAIARALVEGVITDLMLKTNADNVVLDDNGTEVTLSAKLEEYIAALNGKATPADITNAMNSYVKKDGSKVLSTNDFTTALLNKLNGIATGAQVNKIESIKVNGTAQTIASDKSVNVTVPTKVSQLTNDSSYQTKSQVDTAVAAGVANSKHASFQKASSVPAVADAKENILYLVWNSTTSHYDIYAKVADSSGNFKMEQLDDTTVDLSGYVQKVSGKGLSTNDFTAAYKTKLDGIATGANKYTHPSYTAQSSGFWKVTVDATGHVSAVTAVTKADITNLGIPSTNTTYADATQSAHGLMTAADKKKLDGVATGAQVNKIETIKVNGTAQTITSKAVDLAMPVIYAQASEPTGLKAGDLWFQIL